MTAVYTAYLFAQAKARDLWQSPLLPPHLLVQTLMAGSAVLLPVASSMEPGAVEPLGWILAGSSLVHLLMIVGEITLPHTTAHAHLATHEMTRGRFSTWFRIGVVFAAVAALAPWFGAAFVLPVAGVALIGLAAFEHAYVQAGQSVPLA